MSSPLRALCLALACAHGVVATAPCSDGGEPAFATRSEIAHAAASEPGHEHRHGGHGAPASQPSGPRAMHARHPAAHAGHAGGVSPAIVHPDHRDLAPSDEGASWRQPCPCGCDRAPDAGTPGHGLDPGLLLARTPAPAAAAPFLPAAAVPAVPTVFPGGPEPIPLLV